MYILSPDTIQTCSEIGFQNSDSDQLVIRTLPLSILDVSFLVLAQILQKRLKETKDQKTELEERLRHLQFSQSQQQQRPCSHHREEEEGEHPPAAIRGKGDEIEPQIRKQNKHEAAISEQQAERERQEAWMEGMREEQQRLQSEAAYYQQQPSAMARPQAGHQQVNK